jgi:Lon protease-like protein
VSDTALDATGGHHGSGAENRPPGGLHFTVVSETLELGLFPIGMALLPGERVPLHLFEPRYRQLYADCMEGDQPFVLLFADDDGPSAVGCTARFETLVHRFDDGRINVVVLGGQVVEILDETTGQPYLTAHVRPLADEPSDTDPGLEKEVRELFRELSSRVTGAAREIELSDDVPLSFAIAGTIDLGADLKQTLLEERREADRMALVRDILTAAGKGMDRSHVAGERAQRNGKVDHS